MHDDLQIREIRRRLAQGCRILYMESLDDYNLGHASARLPTPDRIAIKPRGLGLEEITPEDLIIIDLDGKVVEGVHSPHGENAIHIEIYRQRADIGGVVHVHPPFTTAFSAAAAEFKPQNQDGALFSEGIPVYEDPRLITTAVQARAMAETMDDHPAVLLRNHGVVTAGRNIEEAVLLAVSLERALRLRHISISYGNFKEMPAGTAFDMGRDLKNNAGRAQDIWNYLVRKLDRQLLGL